VFVRLGALVNLHVAGQIIETTAEHPFLYPGADGFRPGRWKSVSVSAHGTGNCLPCRAWHPAGR
jgi:hypothetical protein